MNKKSIVTIVSMLLISYLFSIGIIYYKGEELNSELFFKHGGFLIIYSSLLRLGLFFLSIWFKKIRELIDFDYGYLYPLISIIFANYLSAITIIIYTN